MGILIDNFLSWMEKPAEFTLGLTNGGVLVLGSILGAVVVSEVLSWVLKRESLFF